jgi:alpha-glucosidase
MGDLVGLCSRLEYLAWLGVDIIWVTPFYPSPMKDQGYDVVDYTSVDPRFGTLEDISCLINKAHQVGLHVVIDLVANHTSSEHPWFRAARSNRNSEYRNYYLWQDPGPAGGPPNNWRSQWGGPAWTLDESTDQYWLHLFLPDQPDLNWRSTAVAREFDRILRFWLEQGVDGFRVDVAHGLKKHPKLPDNPYSPNEGSRSQQARALLRIHDIDQPDVLDVYRGWRSICEPYGAVLLGEVALSEPARVARYILNDDGLHFAFWLETLEVGWKANALRRVVADAEPFSHGRFAWVHGSHDRSRAVSRFGGGTLGRRRSLAVATLLMGLPGMPVIYQGEELGLADAYIPPEAVRDPKAMRTGDYASTRDKSRTPIPWEPGRSFGFTTAGAPWLPFGDVDATQTVTAQQADSTSLLHRFRRLIVLRRSTSDFHSAEAVQWLSREGPLFAYRRGNSVIAANCGDAPATFAPPEGRWTVAFDTDSIFDGKTLGKPIDLTDARAIVLRRT